MLFFSQRDFCLKGVNCIGVPKTIDNDVAHTETTFGYNTAVSVAMDDLDRLHTTATSHHRVLTLFLALQVPLLLHHIWLTKHGQMSLAFHLFGHKADSVERAGFLYILLKLFRPIGEFVKIRHFKC